MRLLDNVFSVVLCWTADDFDHPQNFSKIERQLLHTDFPMKLYLSLKLIKPWHSNLVNNPKTARSNLAWETHTLLILQEENEKLNSRDLFLLSCKWCGRTNQLANIRLLGQLWKLLLNLEQKKEANQLRLSPSSSTHFDQQHVKTDLQSWHDNWTHTKH